MAIARAGILVYRNEPIDRALRRFKKACDKSGIIGDMNNKKWYEKPSDKANRKRNIGILRRKKKRGN